MFQELNDELSRAQSDLETAIRASQKAQEGLEVAEILLITATSIYRKAKMEEKLYTQRVGTLKEKSYNERKMASI